MTKVSSSIVGSISTPMWNDVPLLSLDGSTSHFTMLKRYWDKTTVDLPVYECRAY